ncbi:hypothetical protein ALC57_01440, partial [Trachymyrmex cornetzi]
LSILFLTMTGTIFRFSMRVVFDSKTLPILRDQILILRSLLIQVFFMVSPCFLIFIVQFVINLTAHFLNLVIFVRNRHRYDPQVSIRCPSLASFDFSLSREPHCCTSRFTIFYLITVNLHGSIHKIYINFNIRLPIMLNVFTSSRS